MLNTENWYLVSGAQNKFIALSNAVSSLGLGVKVQQLIAPVEISEQNGPKHKSSRYLYSDKGYQAWQATRELIANNLGLANDVFPKHKSREDSQYLRSMVKFDGGIAHGDLDNLLPECRKLLLADYIRDQFSIYNDNEVDIRLSIGVVPFSAVAMLGLLIQKIYMHYPGNPVQSIGAARRYLDFAAQTNKGKDGKLNNVDYKINARASGSVLHKPLIEWFLQENKRSVVKIDGLSGNSLDEVDDMGNGFTNVMVSGVLAMAERSKKREMERDKFFVKGVVPLTKKTQHNVVWSPQEDRCVVVEA